MFKKLFLISLKDLQLWRIALTLSLIVFGALIAVYFTASSNIATKVSIGFLIFTLIIIVGNWFSNVRLPISRARKKKFDPKIIDSYEQEKTKLSKYQYSEIYLFSKGLAFTISALLPLIISIIFTVI